MEDKYEEKDEYEEIKYENDNNFRKNKVRGGKSSGRERPPPGLVN